MKQTIQEIKKMLESQNHPSFDQSTFALKDSSAVLSIDRMPGDASTRVYYRIKMKDGKNFVGMSMEPFEKEAENLPFLAVQRHLSHCGIDVPAVIDFDPAKGFLLLEDLGDVTLLRGLQDVSDLQVERDYYQRAVDQLVQLQTGARPGMSPEKLDGFNLRFDHEKLMWEVQFTIEHFYQKHLSRVILDADLKVMTDGFSQICQKLDALPTVFTHRDYHSRNLMLTEDRRLVMIDFQDARMGPPQYDLASLLRDSYYQLEEGQISRLIRYYLDQMNARGSKVEDESYFVYYFDLMSVQRNFKAIGSFASFQNRRGITTYLKYVGNTFENIRRTLLKYPEFKKLREVLYHYYYF